MSGVLFACVAGLFLGGSNVTMRRGIARVADGDAGSAGFAFVLLAATASVFGAGFDAGELWPFLVLGIFVPAFPSCWRCVPYRRRVRRAPDPVRDGANPLGGHRHRRIQ